MHSLTIVAIAATSIFSFTSAAPTKRSSSLETGFTINQVANPNFSGRHGPSHYAKAARKYGLEVSIKTTAAAVTGAAMVAGSIAPGSIGANPVGSGGVIVEYICPVTIGSQEFQLDFDTGSSDLWVAGAGAAGAQETYNPTSSALAGQSWSIQYGDGSTASGDVYSDSVTIGGAAVTGQSVELAEIADGTFFSGGSDGLLGLGFSNGNTILPQHANTWFDNAIAQGLPAVFAAKLTASSPGSYDFGLVNNASFTGELSYTDVDSSEGHWMFTPDEGEKGIVDTGTTLILLSSGGTSDYYSGTGATYDSEQQGYIFDCTTTLPDFSITIGSYKATVPGSDINFNPAGEDANGNALCFGAIQSNGDEIDFAIYGDAFLKSQYVVFDKRYGSERLGFAAQAS
ncbi:Type I transmembrane sorting receptor [Thelotrema lepadinum]|nr:Type I transmembrane sorting receptor [Thelotrema lepadinum]